MLNRFTTALLVATFTLISLPGQTRDLVVCMSSTGVRVEVVSSGDVHQESSEGAADRHTHHECSQKECQQTEMPCADIRISGFDDHVVPAPNPALTRIADLLMLVHTHFVLQPFEYQAEHSLPAYDDPPPSYAATILQTIVFLS